MSAIRLAWAYLASRPLLALLHVFLIAIGMATLVLLILVTAQTEDRLARDARPVDLVVGAKGSPLQLILSCILHADIPTGNIPYAEARRLAAHPLVARAIPLSLGDSVRGYRIVGTEIGYLDLYAARIGAGRVFSAPMEAVLGATVAKRLSLAEGATFVGSHGLAASGSSHGETPYRVVGVLAPTGTVIDRLVLTPLESVWQAHEDHGKVPVPDSDAKREVTGMLLAFRSPIAAATLPRQINATTVMQAASPAYETARLMNLVGVGVEALRLFAIVLMVSAAVSVFAALTAAMQERRYDLALLRMLGARPATLIALVLAEGVTLMGAGVILGFALGHAATHLLGRWIAGIQPWSLTGLAWEPAEAGVAIAVIAAGLATCLVPALQAYRRDPALLLRR